MSSFRILPKKVRNVYQIFKTIAIIKITVSISEIFTSYYIINMGTTLVMVMTLSQPTFVSSTDFFAIYLGRKISFAAPSPEEVKWHLSCLRADPCPRPRAVLVAWSRSVICLFFELVKCLWPDIRSYNPFMSWSRFGGFGLYKNIIRITPSLHPKEKELLFF